MVRINASTFGQLLLENSEISIRMMRKLSRRVRLADELLSKVGVSSFLPVKMLDVPEPEPTSASQFLLHEESGEKFYLVAGRATRVGRQDPVTGIDPEIDLSAIDGESLCLERFVNVAGRHRAVESLGFPDKLRDLDPQPVETRGEL